MGSSALSGRARSLCAQGGVSMFDRTTATRQAIADGISPDDVELHVDMEGLIRAEADRQLQRHGGSLAMLGDGGFALIVEAMVEASTARGPRAQTADLLKFDVA